MQQDDTTVREKIAQIIDPLPDDGSHASFMSWQSSLRKADAILAALSPADGATGAIRAAVIEECAKYLEQRGSQLLAESTNQSIGHMMRAIFRDEANAIRSLTPTGTGEQGK